MTICNLGHLHHYELSKMKNEIKIRDYKSSDYDEVQNLWDLTGMGGKERGDDNDEILSTIEAGAKFIVLEKNEMIIGTAWLTHDYRRTYLHHFGIHPDFQGKGLANKLMDKCMLYIKELGYQVKLEVHKENVKAINLYNKYKFNDFPGYELMMNRIINQQK